MADLLMATPPTENDGQTSGETVAPVDATTAFEAARDTCKQVLALTAAILTVTVTFVSQFTKGLNSADLRWLRTAWVLYAVSVVGGVLALMAMTGSVGTSRTATQGPPSIYAGNVRIPAALQLVSFGLGLIVTVIFAWFAVSHVK